MSKSDRHVHKPNMLSRYFVFISVLVAMFLSSMACATLGLDFPAKAAKEWFEALVTMDSLRADDLTCTAKREQFREELKSKAVFVILAELFVGSIDVQTDISDIEFSTIKQEGERAHVKVMGEVRIAIQGAVEGYEMDEKWLMLREEGEWHWCGYIHEAEQPVDLPTPQQIDTPIYIWKVGSPFDGDIPEAVIPVDIQNRAKELGYVLSIESFPAEGFAKKYFQAVSDGTEPDILVFNEFAIITGCPSRFCVSSGATTDELGVFPGIGTADGDPPVNMIYVSGSFESLANNGVYALISTSQNYEAAKALALYNIECGSGFVGNLHDLDKSTSNDVISFALATVTAYFKSDSKTLNDLSGGQYPEESLQLTHKKVTIYYSNVCSLWGNERLAFVDTLVAFEEEKILGQRHLLLILRNTDSAFWELLLISDDAEIVKDTHGQISLLSGESTQEVPKKPVLLNPPDRAEVPRFPERPRIEWSVVDGGVVAYLVEHQFFSGSFSSGSFFHFVSPSVENNGIISIIAPFGAGAQPHRWRIWAINEAGGFSISEWRFINYTN